MGSKQGQRGRRRATWGRGTIAAPVRESTEPERVDIRTADDVSLAATLAEPPSSMAFRGVVVLAHAMFARRTAFERPAGRGLLHFFQQRGYRVISFDFRGHGESGRPASEGYVYGYDDLVRFDLPAVVAAARDRSDGAKVVVVGHSLGGHAALAAQGSGYLSADGIVLCAANVWLREFEPSVLRWLEKRAVMAAMLLMAERRGYFPARALRQGSDDEALRYVQDLCATAVTGRWMSRDGKDDYRAAMGQVRVPVVAIASDGDRLFSHPEPSERFLRACGGKVHFARVSASDDGGKAPGHMDLVTGIGARSVFAREMDWLEAAAGSSGG